MDKNEEELLTKPNRGELARSKEDVETVRLL